MARYKPLEETQGYKRKQAATKKRQLRQRATRQAREMARVATKQAIQETAVELFGEDGLTPAREAALAAVVAGPDAGKITVMSPQHLRYLVRKAREHFTEKAQSYIDEHLKSVQGANAKEQYDVAARHAEWAIEAFGDFEERVVERPAKLIEGKGTSGAIMVGVNLGGVPK